MPQVKSSFFIGLLFILSVSIHAQKQEKKTNTINNLISKVFTISDTVELNIVENDSIEDHVKALGVTIQSSIVENNPDLFLENLHKESLSQSIEKHTLDSINTINTIDKETYKKGFLNGLILGIESYPKQIANAVEQGAYYDFINYRYDNKEQTYYLLFRLFTSEGGVNYHDYKLCIVNNQLAFNDIYIYLAGEKISETLGRMYRYSIIKNNKDNSDDSKNFSKVINAINIYKLGGYKKAYTMLETVEGPVSKDKFMLVLKTQIASQLSSEYYSEALNDLITQFPEDPTIYLMQIDYYILNQNYYEAFDLLDKLQRETNDDFLNYLKANVAFEDKNYDVALNNYKYMMDNYPNFVEGAIGTLSTHVVNNDLENAIKILDRLVIEGYDKKELIVFVEDNDVFEDNLLQPLAKSKLFKKWKRQ